jgi:antitoxin VapB
MGQLNIKDEALIAEAKALAEEMGTSVTGVLREGVRALRAERRQRGDTEQDAFVAELLAIGRRNAALIPQHLRTSDHSDLYDDNGLPK